MKTFLNLSAGLILSIAAFLSPLQAMDESDESGHLAYQSGSLIAPMSRDVSFFFSQSFQKDRIL